jgi:hypothetical protein
MPIPTRARTSALGGYVTGHGDAVAAVTAVTTPTVAPVPPGCVTKAHTVTAVTTPTVAHAPQGP